MRRLTQTVAANSLGLGGGAAVTPPSTKGGETAVAVQEPGALASWVGGRAAANVGGLCGRVAAAIRRHA